MTTTASISRLTELAAACARTTDRQALLGAALAPLLALLGAQGAVVLRREHDGYLVPIRAGSRLDGAAELGPSTENLPVEGGDAATWSSLPVPAGWATDGITRVLARRLPGAPEVLVIASAAEPRDPGVVQVATTLLISALSRRQAEEDLADLVLRVDNAQQLADMGDYDWNIATDTNRWSDQLYRIYGHEPQSFNASYERFLSLLYEEDREGIMGIHQAALATGEPYQMVERIVRPTGELRYLASNGQVVMDESGRPTRMRGTCIDITDRVLAEQRREQSAALFAALVRHSPDGILVVEGGRVVQANPVARTSLGGDPVGRDVAEIIDLSRPERRAVPATGVDGRALRLDLHVATLGELDEEVVAVFLHDSGPRLEREAMAANLREGQVRRQQAVEINDNVLQGLTAAGYALELGDSERAGGYVQQTLRSARKMMWDLMASQEGKDVAAGGLVRSTPATLGSDAPPQPQPAASQERPQERAPRILVADDSDDLRMLLRFQVERKLPGDVVGEAVDGVQAVELARALQPDLVLLDVAMPRMDGIQALPLIREAAPTAKVIMFSGFDERALATQLLGTGAARYVMKGTSMAELITIVREVLTTDPDPLTA